MIFRYITICKKCKLEKNSETTPLLENSYCVKHTFDNLKLRCLDCNIPRFRYCSNHKYIKKYKFLCCFIN